MVWPRLVFDMRAGCVSMCIHLLGTGCTGGILLNESRELQCGVQQSHKPSLAAPNANVVLRRTEKIRLHCCDLWSSFGIARSFAVSRFIVMDIAHL